MIAAITYQDGREVQAPIITADKIKFDFERIRNSWPQLTDAPFLGVAFLAYTSEKRRGETDLDFEDWTETVADVRGEKENADGPKS